VSVRRPRLHCYFFDNPTGPEIWNVEGGRLTQQGKAGIIEDAFLNSKSAKASATNSPALSRLQSPAQSAAGTPAGSGVEEGASGVQPVIRKKKKPTRNQMKAQEERRRLRKLRWLSEGGPKPEDSDSDV
jgi:elongation factor 3